MTGTEAPLAEPEVIPVGDAFRFRWPDLLLEADLGRFAEHRDSLTAELVIATVGLDAGGAAVRKLFFRTSLNLLAGETRSRLAKNLAERRPDIPWQKVLEWVCFVGVEKVREGEPTVDLRTVDPDTRPRWFLKPYVEYGGPTVLFAPGGSGKSYLAEAAAVTAASGRNVFGFAPATPGPVLYLDWETDKYTHAARRLAVCRGAGIDPDGVEIHYRRMVTSLMEGLGAVLREVARLGVVFVVLDSLAAARGGEPESADVTTRLFGAVRALTVPALCIDHVTKTQVRGDDTGEGRLSPFGSVMTENRARNTWSVHAAKEEGGTHLDVVLKHQKTNDGAYQKPHGYRLVFESRTDAVGEERIHAVSVTPTDPARMPNFRATLSLPQQILAHLSDTSDGTASVDELAEALGKDRKEIAPRASELKRRGQLVYLNDRQRYGLASARQEA